MIAAVGHSLTRLNIFLFYALHLRTESPQLNADCLAGVVRLDPYLIDPKSAVRSGIHHLPTHAIHRLDQAVWILGIRVGDDSVVLPSLCAVLILAHELGGVEAHIRIRGFAKAGEEGVDDIRGVGSERGDREAW